MALESYSPPLGMLCLGGHGPHWLSGTRRLPATASRESSADSLSRTENRSSPLGSNPTDQPYRWVAREWLRVCYGRMNRRQALVAAGWRAARPLQEEGCMSGTPNFSADRRLASRCQTGGG